MPDLTRITVNLRSRVRVILDRRAERTRMTQTDLINRAIMLESTLSAFEDEDGGLQVIDPRTGQVQRIYLL